MTLRKVQKKENYVQKKENYVQLLEMHINTLNSEKVYGDNVIEKRECVGHVQKRVVKKPIVMREAKAVVKDAKRLLNEAKVRLRESQKPQKGLSWERGQVGLPEGKLVQSLSWSQKFLPTWSLKSEKRAQFQRASW